MVLTLICILICSLIIVSASNVLENDGFQRVLICQF